MSTWTRKTIEDLQIGDRFKHPDDDGDAPANIHTALTRAQLAWTPGEVEVETEGALLLFLPGAAIDIEVEGSDLD